jgi:hypothetical protein
MELIVFRWYIGKIDCCVCRPVILIGLKLECLGEVTCKGHANAWLSFVRWWLCHRWKVWIFKLSRKFTQLSVEGSKNELLGIFVYPSLHQVHTLISEQSLKDKYPRFDIISDRWLNHTCALPLSVTFSRHSRFSPVRITGLHTQQSTFAVCIIRIQ